MRIIEKKCPNCGAALEFNETDKSCKCNYCKRSFEIERDSDAPMEFEIVDNKTFQSGNKKYVFIFD